MSVRGTIISLIKIHRRLDESGACVGRMNSAGQFAKSAARISRATTGNQKWFIRSASKIRNARVAGTIKTRIIATGRELVGHNAAFAGTARHQLRLPTGRHSFGRQVNKAVFGKCFDALITNLVPKIEFL